MKLKILHCTFHSINPHKTKSVNKSNEMLCYIASSLSFNNDTIAVSKMKKQTVKYKIIIYFFLTQNNHPSRGFNRWN